MSNQVSMKCPQCEGRGHDQKYNPETGYYTGHGAACYLCGGRGYVMVDEAVAQQNKPMATSEAGGGVRDLHEMRMDWKEDRSMLDYQEQATSEAGGGVPVELRERMIAVNQPCFLMIDDGERVDFPDLPALMIDKAIAEIAAAGYALVPTDEMDQSEPKRYTNGP